jgi:hypothetical protein
VSPSLRLVSLAVLIAGSACAAPPVPAPVAPPVVVTPAPPTNAAPPEPMPTREEAIKLGNDLADAIKKGTESEWDPEQRHKWIAAHPIDEAALRRALVVLAEPCLAQREPRSDVCKEITYGPAAVIADALGEGGDIKARISPTMRLFVRLEARGMDPAKYALDRMLTRRMEASARACAPPTDAEIREAARALDDFAVHAAGAARWPSAKERDDLAYFYASTAGTGAPIASADEDFKAKSLPDDHPDLATRAALRDKMRAALLDGEVEDHLSAALAYLRTLGYPAPLRLGEEGDDRWGGAGASFVMRDAARSAEITQSYDLAESLYRRANPAGGMCGTSAPMYYAEQLAGVIRVTELARGCRAAAVERLFAIDRGAARGPERLARAGFDVPRLYAGALLTLGRDDATELEQALSALPSRSTEAVARLRRLGTEAWARRVRAIPGYADTAGGAALDRLLDLAEHGKKRDRLDAIAAIGQVAEDHGYDPCVPSDELWGLFERGSSSLDREIKSVMTTCETRIKARDIGAVVRRLAPLAADPDPEVREAVATALGYLGSPRARDTLKKLARDAFDNGGTVCTREAGKADVCERNLPVARAAREALDALKQADKERAEQKAKARKR